jgi:hypothetical protein
MKPTLLTPCLKSASELCRPSDRRLSAKLVPTFADTRRYSLLSLLCPCSNRTCITPNESPVYSSFKFYPHRICVVVSPASESCRRVNTRSEACTHKMPCPSLCKTRPGMCFLIIYIPTGHVICNPHFQFLGSISYLVDFERQVSCQITSLSGYMFLLFTSDTITIRTDLIVDVVLQCSLGKSVK